MKECGERKNITREFRLTAYEKVLLLKEHFKECSICSPKSTNDKQGD